MRIQLTKVDSTGTWMQSMFKLSLHNSHNEVFSSSTSEFTSPPYLRAGEEGAREHKGAVGAIGAAHETLGGGPVLQGAIDVVHVAVLPACRGEAWQQGEMRE